MIVDVELRVIGVDLDDETTSEVLAERFPNLLWEDNSGLTTVTTYVDRAAMTTAVVELARQLESALPGQVKVEGAFRDLVSTTAIAHRVGRTREAVRKWSGLPGFPAPHAVLEPGTVKVWPWTQIVRWLHETGRVDLDESLPTLEDMVQIDNCLMRNPDATTVRWESVDTPPSPRGFRDVPRPVYTFPTSPKVAQTC